MKTQLAVNQIYDDFISKVILTDYEREILDKYIHGDTYVKMALDTTQSYSTVSRTINELKRKYDIYRQIELTKLTLLQGKKWYKRESLYFFYFDILKLKGDKWQSNKTLVRLSSFIFDRRVYV